MERVGGFGGKADQLNAYYTATGDPDWFNEDLARYRALSVGDISAAAAAVPAARQASRADHRAGEALEVGVRGRSLRSDSRSECFCRSCDANTSCQFSRIVASRRWQFLPSRRPTASHPPQPGPPAALNLPTIQKQKLSNGLPVWIVETHKVPVAQVNLVVLSGTANDPPGKYGIASLAAAMLEEGAGSRSALEIADAVDYLGADLGAATTSDLSAVRLHVPVGAARRRAADHGRRRAAADVPERRARTAARSSA